MQTHEGKLAFFERQINLAVLREEKRVAYRNHRRYRSQEMNEPLCRQHDCLEYPIQQLENDEWLCKRHGGKIG